ncbi:MAG: DUF6751 family protein [Ruthenibacterium sp.]
MLPLEDATLYHCTGRVNHADVWTRTVLHNVYWDAASNTRMRENAQTSADKFSVRIFTQASPIVAINDVLARGACGAGTPQAVRESGATCFTIHSVQDNRRGGANMMHWQLGGA